MSKKKKLDLHKLELVAWQDHPHCLYLNDFRIAGSKPWGGGKIIRTWYISESDLKIALDQKD
jgi:hypothetical protein